MVEVIVSLFILAVGLLGALSMMVNGQKSNQVALFGTEAYLIAGEMADRILAYDDLDTGADNSNYDGIDTTALPAAAPGCIAAGCDRLAQVQYDAWEWGDALSRRLPSGRGLIAYDFGVGVYTVTVMWDSDRTGVQGTGCSGNSNVDLACYQLEVML